VLAIAFSLVGPEPFFASGRIPQRQDDPELGRAADFLVEDIAKRRFHRSTGFIGTKSLMPALSMIGRDDVAFRLLHDDTFPSWGFSIKQGATSIWERWDGWTPRKGFQDPGMNSFAHYSFGAVYGWMAHRIGGIELGPVSHWVAIDPHIDHRMDWAKTSYKSRFGTIATSWELDGDRLDLEVSIPADCTASVGLPLMIGRLARPRSVEEVTEGGQPLSKAEGIRVPAGMLDPAGNPKAGTVLSVGSGTYRFAMRLR
jgi:alpha-L-rhamnosidase